MTEKQSNSTLVDRWITSAKNHRLTATIVFIALILAGIASVLTSMKEIKEVVISQTPMPAASLAVSDVEKLSAVFLEPLPTTPRVAMLLVRNEGSETAVVQNLVFNVNLKTSIGLKNGFGIFFPVGGARAIAPGQSETLRLEPAADGMFLPSEPTNPEFFEFFKNLGKETDIDPNVFRLRQMQKATCQMSVQVKFISGRKIDILPPITCLQVWPLLKAEMIR